MFFPIYHGFDRCKLRRVRCSIVWRESIQWSPNHFTAIKNLFKATPESGLIIFRLRAFIRIDELRVLLLTKLDMEYKWALSSR